MPLGPLGTGLLIAGAGGTGQAIAAGIGNKKRIQAAKEAATVANQRNIENWERANRYNDPSAQMARLKAAGLNPNMVYGSGTQTTAGSVGGASAPVPNIQDIPINLPDVVPMLSQYQNIKKGEAQTALTWGQLGVQALTIESKKLSIEGKQLQNEILSRVGMEMAETKLEGAKADVISTEAGTAKTEEQTKLVTQQIENAKKQLEQMDASIAQMKQSGINQKTIDRINNIKEKMEAKYLAKWEETGIDPKAGTWLRILGEFMQMKNTIKPNEKVTMKKMNEMFPNQIKDLNREQLNILWELINTQYED